MDWVRYCSFIEEDGRTFADDNTDEMKATYQSTEGSTLELDVYYVSTKLCRPNSPHP